MGISALFAAKLSQRGWGEGIVEKLPKPIQSFTAKDAKVAKKEGKEVSTVTDKANTENYCFPLASLNQFFSRCGGMPSQ